MDLIPHIDIVEPDRIDALLSNPENFVWRAIDSETLDTWMPDLGITSYPNPSIFRPKGVAESGLPSTLRHRFWGTVERQTDHTGLRYIGILMYDAVGQECPLEVRLASNDIGRVEPARHDNRRHLIVLDKPVLFEGEMEIFQLIAPGQGVYRIEQFVLLKNRPEPSQFAPQIDCLTRQTQATSNGSWQADLYFTTSEMATIQIQLNGTTTPHQSKQTAPSMLHHVTLSNLNADTPYQATVIATEMAGETACQTITFQTKSPVDEVKQAVSVPVELINLAQANLTGLPVTFGLPLAQGAVWSPSLSQLAVGSVTLPTQARVLARWPDQSAKWVLLDTVMPDGLARPGMKATLVIPPHPPQRLLKKSKSEANSPDFSLPQPLPLGGESKFSPRWGELEGGEIRNPVATQVTPRDTAITVQNHHLRLTVAEAESLLLEKRLNGQWQPLFNRDQPLSFSAIVGDDLQLKAGHPQNITLAENGPQRTVVRFTMAHQDQDGLTHLLSQIALQLYADQPFIKLNHRLMVVSPVLAGRDLAIAKLPPHLAAVRAGSAGEEKTLLKMRAFSLSIPWAKSHTIKAVEQPWPIATNGWQLTHEHDLAYRVGPNDDLQTIAGRARGHVEVIGQPGRLGLGIRNFWQTYPKGIAASPKQVTVNLFPELSGDPLPGDDDAWHRLYFWLKDGRYLLKAGMALTSEVILDFADETAANPALFQWLEQPPVARPPIDYLNQTQALNPIAPKAGSLLPHYETLANQAMASFQQDREHFRAYGQLNFGDWYGESGYSWGNNEYDPAYCAYVEFLRGGQPDWATWGAESVRHLVDVDTLNFSAQPAEIGRQAMHMPGHLGGYLPPLFRSKMAGTNSIPSHTWVEGPLLHYLLTGDEMARDTIEMTKQWLLQKRWFDNYDFTNCRESGWHIIHLCMLYTATNDPYCLNAATLIVRRVLARQVPGGGWVRLLTESHCGCGFPRCQGEAGFMVGVLLSGLKRYHHLTEDEAVGQAIVGGAKWLIEHTFDEASGHFRYTSCPNRTLGGGFQQTQWVLEGLADAYEISGNVEIGRYVENGLKAIGLFPEGLDHLGLGKAMAQQMRYVPTLLAALQQRPLS